MDKRADFFTHDGGADGMRVAEVEHEDRQIVVEAKREGGGVHHAEALAQGIDECDVFVAHGVLMLRGIFVVDPVDLGSFEDDFSANFVGAQRCGRVGGEVGVAGAGDENDHPVLFQMAHGSAQNERFGDLIHRNGRLHPGFNAHFFEAIHDRETVDDGGEHAHIIPGGAIDAAAGALEAAKDVSTANHHANLDPHIVDLFDLITNATEHAGIDGIFAVTTEDFAAQFEHDAFEAGGGVSRRGFTHDRRVKSGEIAASMRENESDGFQPHAMPGIDESIFPIAPSPPALREASSTREMSGLTPGFSPLRSAIL